MGRKKRRSVQFKDSSKIIDMEQARAERQAKRSRNRKVSGESGEREPSPQSSARQSNRKMMMRRRKQRRKAILFLTLAVILVVAGISVGQILMLKHDLHVAQKQQKEYKQEKERMEQDMKEINDLDYLEERARDQMRLIRPGETLYLYPEDMTE